MRNKWRVCRDDEGTPEPSTCPNAALHEPHPTGYVAHAGWADNALQVADQKKCSGCGGWEIWVPKRPDLRIAQTWGDCGCGAEGVGERLIDGEWRAVCGTHLGLETT